MKLYTPFGVFVQRDRKLVYCTAEEVHIPLLNTRSMKRTASERFVMDSTFQVNSSHFRDSDAPNRRSSRMKLGM
jgi:hypothetical protein